MVRFIDYFEDSDNKYLIMEHCSQGSLYNYVKKYGPIPEQKAIGYFK